MKNTQISSKKLKVKSLTSILQLNIIIENLRVLNVHLMDKLFKILDFIKHFQSYFKFQIVEIPLRVLLCLKGVNGQYIKSIQEYLKSNNQDGVCHFWYCGGDQARFICPKGEAFL